MGSSVKCVQNFAQEINISNHYTKNLFGKVFTKNALVVSKFSAFISFRISCPFFFLKIIKNYKYFLQTGFFFKYGLICGGVVKMFEFI